VLSTFIGLHKLANIVAILGEAMLREQPESSQQKDVQDFGIILRDMLEPGTGLVDPRSSRLEEPSRCDRMATNLLHLTHTSTASELCKVRISLKQIRTKLAKQACSMNSYREQETTAAASSFGYCLQQHAGNVRSLLRHQPSRAQMGWVLLFGAGKSIMYKSNSRPHNTSFNPTGLTT
jgi:hypothetical protein